MEITVTMSMAINVVIALGMCVVSYLLTFDVDILPDKLYVPFYFSLAVVAFLGFYKIIEIVQWLWGELWVP